MKRLGLCGGPTGGVSPEFHAPISAALCFGPSRSGAGGPIAVIGGKITALGIDAVESKGATAPISIVFNFTGSQTVQIGNQNTVRS